MRTFTRQLCTNLPRCVIKSIVYESNIFFQDLGSSDLRKDVYIVAHIIRIGRSNSILSFLQLFTYSSQCMLKHIDKKLSERNNWGENCTSKREYHGLEMTVKESPFKNMLETDHANVKIHAILIPNRASDLFIYLFICFCPCQCIYVNLVWSICWIKNYF